ncbi:methyltransferase [Oleiphilus messinensis]|uniref:Methyltransferase n=1 Tax=Oleiphilus messinensis TaxID=141451 RepID=A0A1Y0IJK0_9GAMM|nr:class I SAM-dependent methyltransferase [Oleiphilus messinensis]ARU59564.1 methyltransferase [Oleiphilus messinensis]
MEQDKQVELDRYDGRAKSQLKDYDVAKDQMQFGASAFAEYLRSPYLYYEQCIKKLVTGDKLVLELGAGTGQHSLVLAETGAQVIYTDISENSLKLLMKRLARLGLSNIRMQVADIESLPFQDQLFDVVVCAGSLSYGNPGLVDAEIKRVLKPSGVFVSIDSLNHNPIYKINRWLNYRMHKRTLNVIKRIPDLTRINALKNDFEAIDVKFFGAFTFLMPLIAKVIGEKQAKSISDYLDRVFRVKYSAFKYVLIAQNPK